MANSQILSPKVPQAKDQVFNWKGLAGCGDSLALASAIKNENRLFVIVTADNQTALRLEHELDFFYKVFIQFCIFQIGKHYLMMFFHRYRKLYLNV
jgi:hypothetical protein